MHSMSLYNSRGLYTLSTQDFLDCQNGISHSAEAGTDSHSRQEYAGV